MSVTIKSYLPPEKRERSKLQQVKDKHRSFTLTNKKDIPKDINELKAIKYRDHGITFLNEYMNIDKKMSKAQYCKTHHISHNSLNTGLKILGYKTRINETKQDQLRPIETNQDQPKPLKATRPKRKAPPEIKAGKSYEDKEIDEMINNSLASLSTS
jgi:hypothetical protein